MYSVTPAFAAAIVTSHRIATKVEILSAGVVIGDPIESTISGKVVLDSKAEARGRVDITMVDDGTLGLVPLLATDPLAPYGREIRVSRGITYLNETTEVVPLGVFRVDTTDIEDGDGVQTVTVTGLDRSERISDARITDATVIASGTNVATAILGLVQPAYADVVTDFIATAYTTTQILVEEGADRWAIAQKIASDSGLSLYFNRDGTLKLVSASAGSPVITIAEGAGGLLLSDKRRWTRIGAYNQFVVTGENTGLTTPARGVATDLNPLSPTYALGPFGLVPEFYASQFIVTDAQALDAANGMLQRNLGTTQQVNFGSIVLPHLDPDDVVTITRARAGLNETHVVDQLTIPLGADQAMAGSTRATQVTS